MGHRALIAVEGTDGRYTVYHDQWGGGALLGGTDPAEVASEAVETGRRVGTGLAVSEVLDELDPREYEVLVVRDRRDDVSALLVVWLGLDLSAGPIGGDAAALVPVRDGRRARRIRERVRATKGWLGDAVDAGLLSAETALAWLRAVLKTHPSVPENTVWLSGKGDRG